MIEERKFEGVWIPKEIWLNPELSLIEKVLFVEIKSLDNDNHCTKSNAKFAEFFNCSESTITRGVARLKSLGLIEELPFNGRFRRLKVNDEWVVKMTRQGSQNDEAESSNCRPSNIDSKLDSSKEDNSTNVELDQPAVVQPHSKRGNLLGITDSTTPINKKENKKEKKKSRYEQCCDVIDEYVEPKYIELKQALKDYLVMRLAIKDKPMYVSGWKSMLNKLFTLSSDVSVQIKIVRQSLENSWATFYELKEYKNRARGQDPRVFSEYGIVKTGGDIEEVSDVQF